MVRWTVLFLGVIAVLTGVVGLLAPVSAGPGSIACGTPVATDFSSARAATEHGGANAPMPPSAPETPGRAEPHDDIVVNTDYLELCRAELTDRRMWTVSLAALGAVATLAATLPGIFRQVRRVTGSARR